LQKFADGLHCAQTGVLACVVMQDKFIFPFHPVLNSALRCSVSAQQRISHNVRLLLCGLPWRLAFSRPDALTHFCKHPVVLLSL
jgi:hypothetical protein